MIRMAMATVLLVAAAGCTVSGEEDAIENSIRAELAGQGNVQEVSLVRTDDDHMTGEASLVDSRGRTNQLDCAADRNEGANFSWACWTRVDAVVIEDMTALIEERLGAQLGEVQDVTLARVDEDRMTGRAVVRVPAGEELQMPCHVVRDAPRDNRFSWRCGEDAEAWAAERLASRGGK